MGRKGNSGYSNPDKRFGVGTSLYSGSLGQTQHYLERLSDNLSPLPSPARGYAFWTRADKLVTLNGSNEVTGWGDLSENGNNWIPTASPKGPPGYDTSNPVANNLPTVDFGNEDRLDMSYNSSLDCNGTGGFCVYLVTKWNGAQGSYDFLINYCSDSSWDDGWGINYNNSSAEFRFWVRSWTSTNGTANGGNRAEIASSGISTSNLNIWKMHYDQNTITAQIIGPDADSNTGTYIYSADVPTNKGPQLNGGHGGFTNYTGRWDIAEVVYYATPIDSSDQTITEDYLKERYGLT